MKPFYFDDYHVFDLNFYFKLIILLIITNENTCVRRQKNIWSPSHCQYSDSNKSCEDANQKEILCVNRNC